MPTLDHLPVELVKAVAERLPTQDLLNLRLVNRKLEAKSFDVFKILFKKKTIMLARPSLESLQALSENKKLARQVRTLYVSSYRFQLSNLRTGVNSRTVDTTSSKLIDTLCASSKDTKSSDNEIKEMSDSGDSSESEQDDGVLPPCKCSGFTSSQFQAFAAFLKDQMRSEGNKAYVKLISHAFKNLRNLRSIIFVNPVALHPKSATSDNDKVTGMLGIGKILGAIGATNVHLLQVCPAARWSFERQISCVLEAIAMSGHPLERLLTRRYNLSLDDVPDILQYSNPSGANSIQAMLETFASTSTRFPSLKTLAVEFNVAEDGIGQLVLDGLRDPVANTPAEFARMLKLFPNVSNLSLSTAMLHEYDFPLLEQDLCLSNLTKLSISSFIATEENIICFLKAHGKTLKDLTFHAVCLVDGEWNRLADTVAQMSKLERLEFKGVDNQDYTRFALGTLDWPASYGAALAAHATAATPGNAAGGGPPATAAIPAMLQTVFHALVTQHNLPGPAVGAYPAGGPTTAHATAGQSSVDANNTSAATTGNPQAPSAPANQGPPTPGNQLPTNNGLPGGTGSQQQSGKLYNSVVLLQPDIALKVSELPF